MDDSPANITGVIEESVPPQTTTSASPLAISRRPSRKA
jgi:hypothetical protein